MWFINIWNQWKIQSQHSKVQTDLKAVCGDVTGTSRGRGSHSASRGVLELNANWDVCWRSDRFPSDFTDCTYSYTEAAQQWAMQQQPAGLPSRSTDRAPLWLWASADLPDRSAPLLCQIYTQNTPTFTAAQLVTSPAWPDEQMCWFIRCAGYSA